MEKQPNKRLQWHAAFYAALRIELEEGAGQLIFENEHMLGTKPMQIDVLITKKEEAAVVQKNIGQIFRKYNLVEYKSPDDYLSIDDFYKVLGYAYFYKSDTPHSNEIKNEELSITFVCARYPRELIKYLRTKGHTVEKKEKGIYYIYGVEFPIQIIVNPQLSKEQNLWLGSLTNRINDTQSIEQLAREYEHKKDNKLYSSVMDILIRANGAKFSEVKGMCEALKELFKEELEESWQDGRIVGLSQGISQERENLILKKIRKLKTLEQIAEELESEVEEIRPIYNRVKRAMI